MENPDDHLPKMLGYLDSRTAYRRTRNLAAVSLQDVRPLVQQVRAVGWGWFVMGDQILSLQIEPRTRLVLSIHPYLPIKQNEDGTGGGIRCRMYGKSGEAEFVDVVWGESTEIEVTGGRSA